MMGYYGGFGMGFFGWIWMLLFWAGIIWLIFWLISQTRSDGGRRTAQEILKERYAKGEISKKEYGRMRKDIG